MVGRQAALAIVIGARVLAVLDPVALGERNRTLPALAPCSLNHSQPVSATISLPGYSTWTSIGQESPRPRSYFWENCSTVTNKAEELWGQSVFLCSKLCVFFLWGKKKMFFRFAETKMFGYLMLIFLEAVHQLWWERYWSFFCFFCHCGAGAITGRNSWSVFSQKMARDKFGCLLLNISDFPGQLKCILLTRESWSSQTFLDEICISKAGQLFCVHLIGVHAYACVCTVWACIHCRGGREKYTGVTVASLLSQISIQHVSVLHCSALSLTVITSSLVSGVWILFNTRLDGYSLFLLHPDWSLP